MKKLQMNLVKIKNAEEFFLDDFSSDEFLQKHDFNPLTNIYFTEDDVEHIFRHFKEGSAAGPDGFPSVVLKVEFLDLLASGLSYSIFSLFGRVSRSSPFVVEFIDLLAFCSSFSIFSLCG